MKRFLKTLKGQALWIAGAASAAGLIAISCTTGTQAIIAPPGIPGATFVGSDTCATCHEKVTRDFRTADHAKLQAKGANAKDIGCESCHGPGSKHVAAGGGAGTIVNPEKSPETCFQCHLDKKGEFSMPFSHPVLAGKMGCSDCHDPHKGNATKGGGTQLNRANETCLKCHTQQRGPFVFEHEATREGCVVCHSPHGSTNQKMLTERNSTLCMKCHFQDQALTNGGSAGQLGIGGSGGTGGRAHSGVTGRLSEGSCWTAGCHEGVHGSNASRHLRF